MIDVWEADLALPSQSDADLRAMLSTEEIARADRFHFERDRSRFIRRRAFLRLWISRWLGRDPAGLRFVAGIHGKPALEGGPDGFEFNGSSSGDRALLAISTAGAVGVDLERHRPFEPDLALVMQRFAAEECGSLESLEPKTRARMFFECWSRKEAVIKAVGSGLYLPLDVFAVPLSTTVSVERVRWQPGAGRQDAWWISSLEVGEGWSGAVASENPVGARLRFWNWEEGGRDRR